MAATFSGQGVRITASTTVNKIPGQTLIGLILAIGAAGTVQVFDSSGTATTTPLTGVLTNPGSNVFLPLYLACQQGHYIVITGTVDCTAVIG
ncbi:MAG TPA: hypothetical protein VL614_21180 [Acetobacteraceae bacterium]|jgi:hypothetical protein|nr:hypothetical protein [Acetobacteraceae bacterium]